MKESLSHSQKNILNDAKNLLARNRRTGTLNGTSYDYTCPSPGAYPHQWLWDSSFHSIVLSHFDPERSQNEISTLLKGQKEDGFLACCTLWEKRFPLEQMFYITSISQPPVPQLATEIIYKKSKDKEFLESVYPKLKNFTNWLSNNRDSNSNGLIEIIHPWESGIDSNPAFDKQLGIKETSPNFPRVWLSFYSIFLKYLSFGWQNDKILKSKEFINENMLVNSIYAKSLHSMIFLANEMGMPDDAHDFEQKYRNSLKSLIENSWSEKDKFFYDLDEHGRQIKIKTISGLMPLIIPGLPERYAKPLIENHLINPEEFWTEFPIPSVSLTEPTFNPNGGLVLWRGPSWVNTNWFLQKALVNYGYHKEAGELTEKTTQMIGKYGFREFYNPFTGEGYGQPNFGWSTLIVDMLAS